MMKKTYSKPTLQKCQKLSAVTAAQVASSNNGNEILT